MDSQLTDYFAAWNEPDTAARALLLRRAVGDSVELLDPTGRWFGIDGLVDRIGRFHVAAPGTRVVPSSGVDAHNGVERYTWRIVDGGGNEFMEGIDVAERLPDGRFARILMFHGPPPPIDAAD